MSTPSSFHVLLFDNPDSTLQAVQSLRSAGFSVEDVFSPFPIHGIQQALDIPATRLPWATLIGGIIGGSLGLAFQLWTHAMNWPMTIGGKTHTALPATVPVTFELTILLAAFGTVLGLLFASGLVPRAHSKLGKNFSQLRTTDNQFAVFVPTSGNPDRSKLEPLCLVLAPVQMLWSWEAV
jgi:hypothetical protein